MRALIFFGSVIAVLVALIATPGIGAQEATPEMVVTGEITAEQTHLGVVESFVPTPASLDLFQGQFPPGTSLAYPPGDPGLGLWVIQSGSLTLRNFSGDIVVTRSSDEPTPDGQKSDILLAGTETQLRPGDSFIWTPFLGGEVRNDGTESVVFISVDIRPYVQESSDPGENAATPTS